jgi:hypothetical protein
MWALALVPAALAMTSGLLALAAWLEGRLLSPEALILGAARARSGDPDHVEALVAQQYELLTRDLTTRGPQ